MNIEQETTLLVEFLTEFELVPSRGPPRVQVDFWHLCRLSNAASCKAKGTSPLTVGEGVSFALLRTDPVAYFNLCLKLGLVRSVDELDAQTALERITFDKEVL